MKLFFGQKAKVTPKDSIVELRNTLQMLEKRETFLQTKIDNELKIAKANATKNRRGKDQTLFFLGVLGLLGISRKAFLSSLVLCLHAG